MDEGAHPLAPWTDRKRQEAEARVAALEAELAEARDRLDGVARETARVHRARSEAMDLADDAAARAERAERALRDEVWVVETGEYEQRHVWLVAESPEAAAAEIKRQYGSPYVVEWDELKADGDHYALTGRFSAVPGYSTEHRGRFDMTRYPVARRALAGEAAGQGDGER